MMDRVSITDIARMLKVSRPRVWQLTKRPDFPEPRGRDGGRNYYDKADVLRWATQAGRSIAHKLPLLRQAPPVQAPPARYLHAIAHRDHVILVWDTHLGRIGLVYPAPDAAHATLADLVHQTGCDALAHVQEFIDIDGLPELRAVDRTDPTQTYEPTWQDLHTALGTPPPWWAMTLRRTTEMTRWRPGRTMTTRPVPPVDTDPLLRMANTTADDAVRDTLTHYAYRIDSSAADSAQQDIIGFEQKARDGQLHIAARPLPHDAGEPPEPLDLACRYAWAQLTQASDTLAAECVRSAIAYDGGRHFPGSVIIDPSDDPDDPVGQEWITQLRPGPATALTEVLLARTPADTTLIDPLTDLPATRTADDPTVRTVAPRRLPTHSELAEVAFSAGNVWIRTSDGSLYPAPQRPGFRLSWGYRGSGPTALAILLELLLADITTDAPQAHDGRPINPGLFTLAQQDWPTGATLSRHQLLQARDQPHH